jgi:hypothetical protein
MNDLARLARLERINRNLPRLVEQAHVAMRKFGATIGAPGRDLYVALSELVVALEAGDLQQRVDNALLRLAHRRYEDDDHDEDLHLNGSIGELVQDACSMDTSLALEPYDDLVAAVRRAREEMDL